MKNNLKKIIENILTVEMCCCLFLLATNIQCDVGHTSSFTFIFDNFFFTLTTQFKTHDTLSSKEWNIYRITTIQNEIQWLSSF